MYVCMYLYHNSLYRPSCGGCAGYTCIAPRTARSAHGAHRAHAILFRDHPTHHRPPRTRTLLLRIPPAIRAPRGGEEPHRHTLEFGAALAAPNDVDSCGVVPVGIVITEIMYNPCNEQGSDDMYEFVE